MPFRENQVPREVLTAENSVQAMADTEGHEKSKGLACLLCGTGLTCKEADSSVYMVSSKIYVSFWQLTNLFEIMKFV